MPVDPRRVKELFNAAVELPAPRDRTAFLDRECRGERELRVRLDELLAAFDRPASELEQPIAASLEGISIGPADETAAGSNLADDHAERTISHQHEVPAQGSLVGSIIAGRYKLRQEIGEGGMGSVYFAEQTQPVKRPVALKLIKPGMDSKAVLARFESERQALALMDHPNIAKVFDAGTTQDGRPYFVMELVKGIPLTEFCDQHRLGLPERLRLFRQICSAVQHAHQKGIIHRDLKPTNILVESHDGEAVPKVIDFGLAKATSGMQLTDRSLFTAFGSVAGTPLYMAPEQASFNARDVDTRADIYSLGVILYEILTGSTPIRRETARQAALDEMLRLIREVEPPAPSSRISTSETLPSIAATRQIEPSRLSKFVRGDLDWIVMKALAKERNRRYESAIALAQDIERFTNHEPVTAGPPTAGYRVRKFARRHRVGLVTVGGFAMLLVAAASVSAALAVGANRERVRALSAEKTAREQQIRAQDREQMAIDAVKRFGDVVRQTPALKDNSSLAKLRAALLSESLEFFKSLRDRLQADRETSPESLVRLAGAGFELGSLTAEIGDKEKALRAFDESLAIQERLARKNPSNTEFQRGLAGILGNIGLLQREIGRTDESLVSSKRARAILERLVREAPSNTEFQTALASTHSNIGILQHKTGRPAEALESYGQALAIFERLARDDSSVAGFQDGLATSHNNIGLLLLDTGRPAEALESYRKALAIRERLAGANPSVTAFQSELARTQNNIGRLLRETGRPAEALEALEKALAIREGLARINPAVTEFQSAVAASHFQIGNLQGATGKPTLALASHERARLIRERLAIDNPSVTQLQLDLATSHNNIGVLQWDLGLPAEARESYERARAIQTRLARDHPESPEFASGLGGTLNNIARIDLKQRRFEKARIGLTEAVEWQQKALAGNPDHPGYRQFLTNQLRSLSRTAEGLGEPAQVLATHEHVRTIRERLARENPSVTEFQAELARSHSSISGVQRSMGRPAEALESAEQACAIRERLASAHPESPEFASELGATLNNIAMLEMDQQQYDKAKDVLAQAIDWQRKALKGDPKNAVFRRFLANHLTNLIRAAEGLSLGALADQARQELTALAASDPAKAALDARLAAVLEGKGSAGNSAQRIELASRAYETARPAASARLFAEAFLNDPTLVDDRQAQHAYNAACAAALAGSGGGKDLPPPDELARAKLRGQALGWLKAELAAWARVLDGGTLKSNGLVSQTLKHWKTDADLAGIRDGKELAKLPEAERAASRALWKDVDQLLAKAAGKD